MLQADFDGKKLGSIFNDDTSNMHFGNAPGGCTPAQYKAVLATLLGSGRPGVFAMDGGSPDTVYYRTEVATCLSKYYREVCKALGEWFMEPAMAQAVTDMINGFAAQDTDALQLTTEACRENGVPVVVSYRMNGEDYYHMQLALSDFGRAHAHLSIPGARCLDPANVEVYTHRLDIFREVAEKYDIDGIELNFRRWWHMISNPLHNYPVLTRMIADVRRILDDAAARKGRGRMLLGARVSPLLEGPFIPDEFGAQFGVTQNPSCRDLGLDVKTWIESGDVDYICPTLFNTTLPGVPRIREFAELARDTSVGVYPTLWWCPAWLHGSGAKRGIPTEAPIEPDDSARLLRYKRELCEVALRIYAEGADGISTFNWWPHHQPGIVSNPDYMAKNFGVGGKKVLMKALSTLGDRAALQAYAESEETF